MAEVKARQAKVLTILVDPEDYTDLAPVEVGPGHWLLLFHFRGAVVPCADPDEPSAPTRRRGRRGRPDNCGRLVFQVLQRIGPSSLTKIEAEVESMSAAGECDPYGKTTIYDALTRLEAAGVVEHTDDGYAASPTNP